MVLWSISTFSKIKDRITCLLFSPQCDDVKKKSLQLDYVFLLCVRISTSSYFGLRQLSLCRYLTDQLQKVYVVNETNKVGVIDHTDVFGISIKLYSWPLTLMFVIKDFVIEALRSIAELMIYGDQHDPSFFE